jgi:hypothetical protein
MDDTARGPGYHSDTSNSTEYMDIPSPQRTQSNSVILVPTLMYPIFTEGQLVRRATQSNETELAK